MRKIYFPLLILLGMSTHALAQEFTRPYQDERLGYMEIGLGVVASKAGAAYTVSPAFLKDTRLGWQVFFTPQFIVSPHINVGLKLGGVFRPKFFDVESNSQLQSKFTPFAMPMADFYFSGGGSARFFIGVAAGATYIGKLEARNALTDDTYYFRRRDRDIFFTVAPHFGVVFGDLKISVEHMVTMPFNPDITSLTLSNTIPMGKRRFF
ncbi:hypothetical protein [Persicitalea jodogahamensis]|uniref:Outer membrane protein beta-barrel domain-containing protein n=1 Tax=Persicitalea jodogahamensis TaxID=402147 RepID=A0A8J3G8Z7_9BACT|nr:hypothetical protein [Persicitalea jodogahamensis]GHB70503.1 hypothetical protein GCM10007390_25240 [Persicitalea jodogahamensis]